MTNYPHLHFGLLLCLPQTIASVLNSSLVLWHWQWCLEAISFCHAHTLWYYLQYIFFLQLNLWLVSFQAMRMPNYIVFPPFIAIFFLYHNKKKRVPFLLTTCNWLQAIHFLELFLSFRNSRHFLLRSNLISLSCLCFSLKFKHSQVIVICWNYAFLFLSKLCFWNHLIFWNLH